MNTFEAIYGQDCLTPTLWHVSTTCVKIIDQMFMRMQIEQNMITKCMKKAPYRSLTYVNKEENFRKFDDGDMVFLKVALKRSQLKLGKGYKPSPTYYEPFQIIKKIETMAYELGLPPRWRIHDVTHVIL
jgi:hypothetical protein